MTATTLSSNKRLRLNVLKEDFGDKNIISFSANIVHIYEGLTQKREFEIVVFRCQEECSNCQRIDFKLQAGYCASCTTVSN